MRNYQEASGRKDTKLRGEGAARWRWHPDGCRLAPGPTVPSRAGRRAEAVGPCSHGAGAVPVSQHFCTCVVLRIN